MADTLLINFDESKNDLFNGIEFDRGYEITDINIELYKNMFQSYNKFYVYGLGSIFSSNRSETGRTDEITERFESILYMFLNIGVIPDFDVSTVVFNSLFGTVSTFLFTQSEWDMYVSFLSDFDYNGMVSGNQLIVAGVLDSFDDFKNVIISDTFEVVNVL